MHRLALMLMKLVARHAITIKYYFLVKKFLTTLFIILLFCNIANSKGISFDRQKNLIDSGSIETGMNCNNLSRALGGSNDLSWRLLGNKDGKYGHYVLIEVYSKEPNRIYYICEQKRVDYESSESILDALKDQDLIKIFYNPIKMFTYVFTVTSQGSIEYILSKLTISDFNITRAELTTAYAESLLQQLEIPKEETAEVDKTIIDIPEEKTTTVAETKKDKEGPIIEISELITVDSRAYSIKGKVKDKSDFSLKIDGAEVEVDNNGNFTLKRFNVNQENVEELKIVAIDKWQNKSEKIVKVVIKLPKTKVAKIYEALNPNKVRTKASSNKVAIIIGIEKYENLADFDATFANRDAVAFSEYVTNALGVEATNKILLVDKGAKRRDTLKAFKLWLPKIASDGGKDIYFFFAGHGLASDDGKDLFILPYDGDTALLEDTAISRLELISLIEKVNPKSVTMFFDTCYSGQTRDEKNLVASLRPILLKAAEQDTPNNFHIFSASNNNQTSGSIEEAKHGIFSYYLMKGLEGNADGNKDDQITNGELFAYLATNVSKESFTQNREQEPTLSSGDPNQVLMKY